METEHTETVVEKAVNFVKDAFGISHATAPEVIAKPKYSDKKSKSAATVAMPPESGAVFEDEPEHGRRDASGFPRSVEDR